MRCAINANNIAAINANSMECVSPRCVNKTAGIPVYSEATKSISGRLCAMAPSSIARLPIFFPKKASPMQAPRAICVSESICCKAKVYIQLHCNKGLSASAAITVAIKLRVTTHYWGCLLIVLGYYWVLSPTTLNSRSKDLLFYFRQFIMVPLVIQNSFFYFTIRTLHKVNLSVHYF